MDDQVVKSYEVSFLAKNENGAASLVKNLSRFGGEILDEGDLEEIKLSYPISRQNSAYFGCIHCKLPPNVISDINEALKLEGDILRFLIVSPPFDRGRVDRAPRQEIPASKKEEKIKEPTKTQAENVLSNDLLEEKLEEILK